MKLAEMMARQGGRQRFDVLRGADAWLDFVTEVSPSWMRPNHLRPIASIFPRAERGPVRVCVSSPPRHGKTDLLLHMAVRWIKRHPSDTVGFVTHNSRLALSKSKYARAIALRAGLQLAKDSQNAGEWRTVHGGGMLAAGRESGWSGFGVNVFILDDLVADRMQGESQIERDNIDDFFRSTALMRVEPGGTVIVNMTRWHPDDLIGRLAVEGWEYINIPVQNARGEWLWPERWPIEEMEKKKRESGEYEWASLHMGMPRPRGVAVFHEPARYRTPLDGAVFLIACDPATTASTASDYSVILVACAKNIDGFMHMDIRDVRRMQVETPSLVRELVGVQQQWKVPVVVEAVGGFKGVPQTLRALDRRLQVTEIHPLTDKLVRAQRISGAWNDGRVRVPEAGSSCDAPWVEPFVREMTRFTGTKDPHDDQVDAAAHCFNTLENMLRQRRNVAAHVDAAMPFG